MITDQDSKNVPEMPDPIKAQWERAKRDGLLELHPDSINPNRPQE